MGFDDPVPPVVMQPWTSNRDVDLLSVTTSIVSDLTTPDVVNLIPIEPVYLPIPELVPIDEEYPSEASTITGSTEYSQVTPSFYFIDVEQARHVRVPSTPSVSDATGSLFMSITPPLSTSQSVASTQLPSIASLTSTHNSSHLSHVTHETIQSLHSEDATIIDRDLGDAQSDPGSDADSDSDEMAPLIYVPRPDAPAYGHFLGPLLAQIREVFPRIMALRNPQVHIPEEHGVNNHVYNEPAVREIIGLIEPRPVPATVAQLPYVHPIDIDTIGINIAGLKRSSQTPWLTERNREEIMALRAAELSEWERFQADSFVPAGMTRRTPAALNENFISRHDPALPLPLGLSRYYYSYGEYITPSGPDAKCEVVGGWPLQRDAIEYVTIYSQEMPYYRSWYTFFRQVYLFLGLVALLIITAYALPHFGVTQSVCSWVRFIQTIIIVVNTLVLEYRLNPAGREYYCCIHRTLIRFFSTPLPVMGNLSTYTSHSRARCVHEQWLDESNYIRIAGDHKSFIIQPVFTEMVSTCMLHGAGSKDKGINRANQLEGRLKLWQLADPYIAQTSLAHATQQMQVLQARKIDLIPDAGRSGLPFGSRTPK